MCRLLFLFLRVQIFAASSSAVVALAASPQSVYEIDAATRGNALITTFNTLSISSGANVPWAAFQTTLPTSLSSAYGSYKAVYNGIIPYVQSIMATTYNTLFIVKYLPSNSPSNPQYIVLPTEQVVDLLYFPLTSNQPTSSAPFTAGALPNSLAYYSVDPFQRAADIVSAVQALMNQANVVNFSITASQVWIQTTINGPYNPGIPNGLLQHVLSISMSGSGLLQITFLTLNQSISQTVYIPPEQVQQVIFVRNFNAPTSL